MKTQIIKVQLLTLFVMLFHGVSGQEMAKSSIPSTKYDRSALTMILLSYPNENQSSYVKAIFPNLTVPDKFDDNTLKTQVFNVEQPRSNQSYDSGLLGHHGIVNAKIGNAIIAKWYNRQPDGSFNLDVLSSRGLYNATEADFQKSSVTKRGISEIKDYGQTLLANSYILIFDYYNILSSEQKYTIDKVAPENRVFHGWTGNYTAYLYKLDLNDSILSYFYNELWFEKDASEAIKLERSKQFESASFPVSYVTLVGGMIASEQPKPGTSLGQLTIQKSDDQLLYELVQKGIKQAETALEKKVDAFNVKSVVYTSKPITSKIGRKEGLSVDDRYFLYEFEQGDDGVVKMVKKAVVRATNSIADNRRIATSSTDNLSTFYQIAGKKIENGLLLKQKNDKGIGLYAKMGTQPLSGTQFGFEYLASPFIANYIGLSPTSLRIFAEYGLETTTYTNNDYFGTETFEFTRYNFGLNESFYFARNYQLQPEISFGGESTYSNSAGRDLNAKFIKGGLKFGANLFSSLQIMAGGYYYYFLSGMTDSDGNTTDTNWFDYFPGRQGVTYDIGIRLQF